MREFEDMSTSEIEQALSRAGWPKELVQNYLGQQEKKEELALQANAEAAGIIIELKAYRGEIITITGRKDTTKALQLLAGIIPPEKGGVIKGKTGYCPKEPALVKTFTIRENIDHWRKVYESGKKPAELLGELSYVAYKKPPEIPLGLQKQVDIICATLNEPDILFIEEPLHGIEAAYHQDIWNQIKKAAKGRTVIISSHPHREVEKISTRIAILSQGRIALQGSPADFRKQSKGKYIVGLELEEKTKGLAQELKAKYVDGKCVIVTPSPLDIVQKAKKYASSNNDKIIVAEIRIPGMQDILEALA